MQVPGTFRAAVEAKDLAAITRALDPGVEFRSPVMVKPYLGRDAVSALLAVLLEVFDDFHYTDELVGRDGAAGGPPTAALIFTARVRGTAVQGLDLLRFGDGGLVTGLTVMVRPLPAAMTLARVVGRRMEAAAAERTGEPPARPSGDDPDSGSRREDGQ